MRRFNLDCACDDCFKSHRDFINSCICLDNTSILQVFFPVTFFPVDTDRTLVSLTYLPGPSVPGALLSQRARYLHFLGPRRLSVQSHGNAPSCSAISARMTFPGKPLPVGESFLAGKHEISLAFFFICPTIFLFHSALSLFLPNF